MDGLAKLDDGDLKGQAGVGWSIDEQVGSGAFSYGYTDINEWFNVKGTRLLNLDSGVHTVDVWVNSEHPGTMEIHGDGGPRTCVNYLILGEQ